MGVKISNLPIASPVITGSEEIPLVQSGVTRVSTISALVPYLSAMVSNAYAISGNYAVKNVNNFFTAPQTVNALSSVNNITAAGNITTSGLIAAAGSIVPVSVYTLSADKIFTDVDTNKVFHFNTNATILNAIFSPTLSNGFNVALMNVGTNSLVLSTNPSAPLRARSNTVADLYGGAFVYKDSNSFYAAGRL